MAPGHAESLHSPGNTQGVSGFRLPSVPADANHSTPTWITCGKPPPSTTLTVDYTPL